MEFKNDLGKPWKFQDGDFTVYRSSVWSPPGCHPVGCGIKIYVDKDGRMDHIEGDENDPITHGRLCPRCLALKDYVYNPSRVIYPMKRAREKRGDADAWERITWDEAIDIVSSKLRDTIDRFGNDAVFIAYGTNANCTTARPFNRLMNCLGGYLSRYNDYSCAQATWAAKYCFGMKPDDGSSTGWNGAGNYKCGSGSGKLAPGEYYIVKTSSNYSALLWDGKKKDDKGQPLAYDITIDGTHTLVTLESGYELYISGCKFINTASEHPKAVNGKYAPGTYKIGRDIQKGEYIIKKASGAYGGLSFKKSVDPYVQNVASDFKMVDVSVYYTLSKDGYVHITGCELYDAASHDMASIGCDGTTPAMYKVGKDIKAGTYTITPDGSGKSYYAVYKNSTDATDSARIAETRITKATNVAVSDGEYIWFYKASMKYCQNPNSGLDFDATAASE